MRFTREQCRWSPSDIESMFFTQFETIYPTISDAVLMVIRLPRLTSINGLDIHTANDA